MLARGGAAKPKLTLSVASVQAAAGSRPTLSLKSPATLTMNMAPLRSPRSPRTNMTMTMPPASPTTMNTQMNQRGFSTVQQQQQQPPTTMYSYVNHSTSRSILKKKQGGPQSAGAATAASARRCGVGRHQLKFADSPQVRYVAPIEDEDYYGTYKKLTKEERRWMSRP